MQQKRKSQREKQQKGKPETLEAKERFNVPFLA